MDGAGKEIKVGSDGARLSNLQGPSPDSLTRALRRPLMGAHSGLAGLRDPIGRTGPGAIASGLGRTLDWRLCPKDFTASFRFRCHFDVKFSPPRMTEER
jgi:hypothetical protein